MSETTKTPYEETHELLKHLNQQDKGWSATGKRGILVMDGKNDPFYAGQEWQLPQAEWFADAFRKLGYEGKRVHLRRIHYILSGELENPVTGRKEQWTLWNGEPYENTTKCWEKLLDASKYTRNMGLVDPALIIDRRTPRPFIFAPTEAAPEPGVSWEMPTWYLPEIDLSGLEPELEPPRSEPIGYRYRRAMEPSLVEVWMEKSLDEADDPIVERVCEQAGVNLVTGIGFMTISSIHSLLKRRAALEKPLRILYLSDFDPAGKAMPISPARHVEFAIREMPQKPDIRLVHLALTEEQVIRYRLPRIPIKEGDLRKKSFEEKYGEGAVELNAFFENHPDEFTRMLRGSIQALRDPGLLDKIRRAREEAQVLLDEQTKEHLRNVIEELEEIEAQTREIGRRYRSELQPVAERLEAEMAPYHERLQSVRHDAQFLMEELEENVELPTVESEEPDGVADGWLFDSRRDYLEQLRYYKKHQRK